MHFQDHLKQNENDNAVEVGITVYEALSEAGGMNCNTLAAAEGECGGRMVSFGFRGH